MDHAKAVCIIFVVMMHSVLGVEEAAGEAGWMHPVVQFAAPFRMPDFFMISGLFTALVLARPWRLYADRKVLHFAYFYVLWLTIQFALKAPSFAAGLGWWGVLQEYLISFVQPFGTLWFIYLLAVFFVVTKVLHDLKVPWPLTLAVAALLQILPIETGIYIADYFAERFVYFFAGYVFASRLFALADWAAAHRPQHSPGLGCGRWSTVLPSLPATANCRAFRWRLALPERWPSCSFPACWRSFPFSIRCASLARIPSSSISPSSSLWRCRACCC
ncbi:acyltransferase family protein [Pannonibacter sp. Pt2-lr]